ncbi:hypothetical protein [Deinococcus sp.]|uniref:hypothetical protein n=1 Tax=Deinococcus sp. TaxID=47478 RepID=UPI003C798C22
MTHEPIKAVHLRSWCEDDLSLLTRLLGDPEMMTHLGGPETPEQIAARREEQKKYGELGMELFQCSSEKVEC